jgi:hypothetical protein
MKAPNRLIAGGAFLSGFLEEGPLLPQPRR